MCGTDSLWVGQDGFPPLSGRQPDTVVWTIGIIFARSKITIRQTHSSTIYFKMNVTKY